MIKFNKTYNLCVNNTYWYIKNQFVQTGLYKNNTKIL